MKPRSGFTLIEVIVSIALTGVVSLLVYGAAQAGRHTGERIAEERRGLQTAMGMRSLLAVALASAQTRFRPDDTVFVVGNRSNARGIPADRLTFIAAGGFPPLSPGADWTVTLEPGPGGLQLSGEPRGIRGSRRVLALLPGVTGLEVRVLVPGKEPVWSEEWNFPNALPKAVELTYWTASGRVGVPLAVSLALGQVH